MEIVSVNEMVARLAKRGVQAQPRTVRRWADKLKLGKMLGRQWALTADSEEKLASVIRSTVGNPSMIAGNNYRNERKARKKAEKKNSRKSPKKLLTAGG